MHVLLGARPVFVQLTFVRHLNFQVSIFYFEIIHVFVSITNDNL